MPLTCLKLGCTHAKVVVMHHPNKLTCAYMSPRHSLRRMCACAFSSKVIGELLCCQRAFALLSQSNVGDNAVRYVFSLSWKYHKFLHRTSFFSMEEFTFRNVLHTRN